MDEKIMEIKKIQEQLDYRTKIENEAISLIVQCKVFEAIELLDLI